MRLRWYTPLLGFRPVTVERQYLLYKNRANQLADRVSLGIILLTLAVVMARFRSRGTVVYSAADAAAAVGAAAAGAAAVAAAGGSSAAGQAVPAAAGPAGPAAAAAAGAAAAVAGTAAAAGALARTRHTATAFLVNRCTLQRAWRLAVASSQAWGGLPLATFVACLMAAPYLVMLTCPVWYLQHREALLLVSGLAVKPMSVAGCRGVVPFTLVTRVFRSHALFSLFRASVNLVLVQQVGEVRL